MTTPRASLSDFRKHSAWAGSVADLGSVLRAMESQYADMRPGHIEDATKWERAAVGRAQATVEDIRRRIDTRREEGRDTSGWETELESSGRRLESEQAALAASRDRAEKFDQIVAEVRTRKGADQTVIARPAEIAEFLTHIDVRDLTLRAPSGPMSSHRISVHFDRAAGVELRVTADDERWARAALSQVDEAVERKVPWWRRLRSGPLVAIVLYLTIYVLFSGLSRLAGLSSSGEFWWWPFVLGFAAVVAAVAATDAVRKVLPAFELTSGAPRTRAVIGVLGGWCVSVALGVITNAISN